MTPREYVERVVKPLQAEFERQGSLPSLFAAVVSTVQITEYIAVANGSKPEHERDKALSACSDFLLIYSVATAQKHSEPKNKTMIQGVTADSALQRKIGITARGKVLSAKGRRVLALDDFQVEIGGDFHSLHRPLRETLRYFDSVLPA